MNIYVDKNQVNKIANNMIGNCESFSDQIKQLMFYIEKLENAWQGADAQKYIGILKNDCVEELKKFQETLVVYSNYLSNVSDGYDTLDTIYSAKKIS